MKLTSQQTDRAVGAVLASAAGDALGAPYEFGPALSDEVVPQFGIGSFGHATGEWTDDTAMAMPILQVLADGRTLEDETALDEIVSRWREWARTAKDVGNQTRSILSGLSSVTAAAALARAEEYHLATGRSAGNGSLMRTGPVALGYLDRTPAELVDAAGHLARLTHWEQDNADAVGLWCLAIRHGILTGELDVTGQLDVVFGTAPSEARQRWTELVAEATRPDAHPRDFRSGNGWVVRAFQSALAAVAGARSLRDAVERAVRGGGDTDTIAAIAGALAGAVYGGSAVPLEWKRKLHGWPGADANGLVRLASLAARHGQADDEGWPLAERARVYEGSDFLVQHPHDTGVWLGSIAALDRLPDEVDAAVSLCRVGTRQVPPEVESVQVWLIDRDGRNQNLDFVLAEAADAVAALRAEGRTVFLHCAEGRSRTSAVAALYAALHRGAALERAWSDVRGALPGFAPQPFLRDAVERIAGAR